MEEEILLVETRGAVRLLTMNRPKKLNALNHDLIKALTEALLAAQRDDAVAAVILAGAGRAFCPGMDTSAPRVLTAESRKALVQSADESIALFKLLARIDKPVIAAVHGYALGAGCGLALEAISSLPPRAPVSAIRNCAPASPHRPSRRTPCT